MADTAASGQPQAEGSPADSSRGTKRNAFTELMSPKKKAPPPASSSMLLSGAQKAFYSRGSVSKSFRNRDGLGAYTADPKAFPPSRVIYHNDAFVAIHDMYPKSSVHALLLPRPPPPHSTTTSSTAAATADNTVDRTRLHPFDAFEDPVFLAAVRAETAKLRRLVAKELQRRFGPLSASDRAREAVLNGEVEVEVEDIDHDDDDDDDDHKEEGREKQQRQRQVLPAGRDWLREVRAGVHAHPSMNDLHVHVFSRDMRSPDRLRSRKHYNSFNTGFLVDVDDFPLPADDPRRHPGREGYLGMDMRCWRCGEGFGNRVKALKEHLEGEFEEWVRE